MKIYKNVFNVKDFFTPANISNTPIKIVDGRLKVTLFRESGLITITASNHRKILLRISLKPKVGLLIQSD